MVDCGAVATKINQPLMERNWTHLELEYMASLFTLERFRHNPTLDPYEYAHKTI